MKRKLLFICTFNIARSRTAEDLFRNSKVYETKSAGIIYHPEGGQVITQDLINWADVVVAMNETEESNGKPPCRHLSHLLENFNLRNKEIAVLNIPNIYRRGDSALVQLIITELNNILSIQV